MIRPGPAGGGSLSGAAGVARARRRHGDRDPRRTGPGLTIPTESEPAAAFQVAAPAPGRPGRAAAISDSERG